MLDRLAELFLESADIPPQQVTLDATFEELSMDSLDKTQLLMAIEDEFKIEIDDEIANEWQSVGDIINYLQKKVSNEQS